MQHRPQGCYGYRVKATSPKESQQSAQRWVRMKVVVNLPQKRKFWGFPKGVAAAAIPLFPVGTRFHSTTMTISGPQGRRTGLWQVSP